MRKAKIKCVSKYPYGMFAFNGAEIDYFNWPEEGEESDVRLVPDDGTEMANPSVKALTYDDNHFFAHLKRQKS